jgi:peroxiredoxin
MSIQVGDRIPELTLTRMGPNGPETVSTTQLLRGRRVVLFAVPGAYTPTCSAQHLPGFVTRAAEIRATGVDEIVCLAVNDAFVMDAWGREHEAATKVSMIADGNGDFTRAMGLDEDRRDRGMGVRTRRCAMLIDDGVVTTLHVEEPGAFTVSSAEAILATL